MKPFCRFAFAPLLLALALTSCGRGKEDKKAAPPALGPMTQAFTNTSRTYQIPMNILLALAYKESQLNADPSRVAYAGIEAPRGPAFAQTMMGLSYSTLGLSEETASDTSVQLSAYGAWVQQGLRQQRIDLPMQISKSDEIYDWIWQLARLHHPDAKSSKNIQVIFAREMIEILNKGFIWQDADSRERIEQTPLSPRLETSSFSPPIQANLQLDTRTSEIFLVDYLQLSYAQESGETNHPKRIEIIHCPFSLSTCIADPENSDIQLQAHYIIPADESLLPRPIKVLQHRTPVTLSNEQGANQLVTDAVVIMLVGNSGRYADDQRKLTNPSWYSKRQLQYMGEVVSGVCQLMSKDDPTIDYQNCRSDAVKFRTTPSGANYRFGDIPDFEAAIFWSFVRNTTGPKGDVTIQLPSQSKTFPAGTAVTMNIGFITGAAKLEIQHLERCASGKTIWTVLQTLSIRNESSQSVIAKFFDQGPNLNGQHFFRALTYDARGELMGWAVTDYFLTGYDTEGVPGPKESLCNS